MLCGSCVVCELCFVFEGVEPDEDIESGFADTLVESMEQGKPLQ